MSDDVTQRPWDRLPDEDHGWYQRFLKYRDLGADRSLLGLYNDWREEQSAGKVRRKKATSVSAAWVNKAKTWNWRERAEAWDMEQARIRQRGLQALADEWLLRMKQLAQALFNKLTAAVRDLETQHVKWVRCPKCENQIEITMGPPLDKVTGSLVKVFAELRMLFGIGEQAAPEVGGGASVVIYLPDNGRGDGDSKPVKAQASFRGDATP